MGLDHDQKLITARVSPFAHAYYVWSTSVTAIVSYPAHGMTEWLNDRSHYSTTTSLGEVWMRLQIWTISDTCLVTSGWYGQLGVHSSTSTTDLNYQWYVPCNKWMIWTTRCSFINMSSFVPRYQSRYVSTLLRISTRTVNIVCMNHCGASKMCSANVHTMRHTAFIYSPPSVLFSEDSQ